MALPAPNKIHSLPVRVTYHVSSNAHTFTTLLDSPQQVYVHPPAGPNATQEASDGNWGSIYLKTVAQGVLMASPELNPFAENGSDLSLYILDPRETYSRRQRVSSSSSFSSSSAGPSSSPHAASSSSSQTDGCEVWSGKGRLTWALREPGDGKILVTGRLVRSTDFGAAVTSPDLPPLEALAAAYDEMNTGSGAWGIEIELAMKEHAGATAARQQASSAATATAAAPVPLRKEAVQVSRSMSPLGFPGAGLPSPAGFRPNQANAKSGPKPGSSGTTRRPTPQAGRPKLAEVDLNGSQQGSTTSMARTGSKGVAPTRPLERTVSEESFPSDIPSDVYNKPDSLTKEQAARLLASPAFLDMLEKASGASLSSSPALLASATTFAAREYGGGLRAPQKRMRHERKVDVAETPKCFNCGRVKSSVWRCRKMENGEVVRVCNACGLYYNKQRVMRPPSMWQGVDDDIKHHNKEKKNAPPKAAATPTPELPSSPAFGSTSGGFKRTLSAVAEQDAKRIATQRSRPNVKSGLSASVKPVPATSPVRPLNTTRHAVSRGARSSISIPALQPVAASSPGFAPAPHMTLAPASSPPRNARSSRPEQPTRTSPRRRASVAQAEPQPVGVESLAMPLSDDMADGGNAVVADADWSTQLSALLGPGAVTGAQMGHADAQIDPASTSSSGEKRKRAEDNKGREPSASSEDDLLSQLFEAETGPETSSPAFTKFDFSQLPPSSPPLMPTADYSTLLSSPDNSPSSAVEQSPEDHVSIGGAAASGSASATAGTMPLRRRSPRKAARSGLSHSFTPADGDNTSPEGTAAQAAAAATTSAVAVLFSSADQPITSDTDLLASLSLDELNRLLGMHAGDLASGDLSAFDTLWTTNTATELTTMSDSAQFTVIDQQQHSFLPMTTGTGIGLGVSSGEMTDVDGMVAGPWEELFAGLE